MQNKYLLALTSHGNAPYLMSTRLAHALGSFPVIIPDYYGATQRKIIQEEISGCSGYVYFSKELGNLFKPLLLDAKNAGSFADFAEKLVEPHNPDRISEIENKLNNLLREGLTVSSFDLNSQKIIYSDQVLMVLNSALPLRTVNIPQVYFFTGKLSRIYGESPDPHMDRIISKQHGLAEAWNLVERDAAIRYVPRINAFSYQNRIESDLVYTPPFAPRRDRTELLENETILFVPSGTGTDVQKLERIKTSIPKQFQILEMTSDGFSKAGFDKTNSTGRSAIYGDTQLQAVIFRGGWGTVWECLQNGIPMGVVRTTYLEDPEMGHSHLSLERLGLGRILDESIKPMLQGTELESIRTRITDEQNQDILEFGNLSQNGFEFIAEDLQRSFPEVLHWRGLQSKDLTKSGQENHDGKVTIGG